MSIYDLLAVHKLQVSQSIQRIKLSEPLHCTQANMSNITSNSRIETVYLETLNRKNCDSPGCYHEVRETLLATFFMPADGLKITNKKNNWLQAKDYERHGDWTKN